MDRTWIIDFDGTLIDVDLGRMFVSWMHSTRRIKKSGLVIRALAWPLNELCRRCGYGQIVQSWSTGLSVDAQMSAMHSFLDEECGSIVVNEHLLSILRLTEARSKIVLTGCNQILVQAFLETRGIRDFDAVIGLTTRGNIWVIQHPYSRSKVSIAKKYHPYVAVGDSWSDRHLLNQATESIVIDGDRRLRLLAEAKAWKVFPRVMA